MSKEKRYAFAVPATYTFHAFVYATSLEEAEKKIANGEYEDGSQENDEFDFSKAKYYDEWDT